MNVLEIGKKAHIDAFDIAKGQLPQLDINEIIQEITLIVKKEKTIKKVAGEFASKYKEPAEVYEKALMNLLVQEGLKAIPDEKLESLIGEEFADKVMDVGKLISSKVKSYAKKEITVSELIISLKEPLKDIGFDILGAHGYNQDQLRELSQALATANWFAVAEIAFTEVYKILKQVDEEAQLAHEHRILVEEECKKSITLMKQYRNDFNAHVSEYLSEHLETFESGLSIMNNAILENDTTGYIKGNVQIQEMLGYKIQFTNEDEFEALMNSDEAFKL